MNESAKFMKNAYVGWTGTAGMHVRHDYDPEKLRKIQTSKKKMEKRTGTFKKDKMTMTMIIPFTFICEACEEFNYLGKKQYFKVEPIKGEKFLGLAIYRFLGRCTHCSNPFTFRTDPKTGGYQLETGGRRTRDGGGDAAAENEQEAKEAAEQQERSTVLQEVLEKQKRAKEQIAMQDNIEEMLTRNRAAHRDRYKTVEMALDTLFAKPEAGTGDGASVAGSSASGASGSAAGSSAVDDAEDEALDMEEYLAEVERAKSSARDDLDERVEGVDGGLLGLGRLGSAKKGDGAKNGASESAEGGGRAAKTRSRSRSRERRAKTGEKMNVFDDGSAVMGGMGRSKMIAPKPVGVSTATQKPTLALKKKRVDRLRKANSDEDSDSDDSEPAPAKKPEKPAPKPGGGGFAGWGDDSSDDD